MWLGGSRVAVGSVCCTEREGSTGRSQSGGNPPFSNNFFSKKYKYNKYRGNPPFSNNFFNNKYKYNKYRGNPPFPNNVFDNKYTIGSTNTNADLKQPQIHKHLKNARGQTNPFFKNINTEKQDSKNNNKTRK